jgi:protein gp37
MSKIEWCDETWNPIVGCQIISEGCRNCYAAKMAYRLQSMNVRGYEDVAKKMVNGSVQWTNRVQFVEKALQKPLNRKKSKVYFVNSMSDLFHDKVDFNVVEQIFHIVEQTPHHKYQILTKRSTRMVEYFDTHYVPDNVWLGVSVEDQKSGLPRIDELRKINSKRFLSIEPLLEDLGEIDLSGISWVIVGGESGEQARPMKAEWVENILLQCQAMGIEFFFKQWGTWSADGQKRSKKENGRLFDGKVWDKTPIHHEILGD